MKTKPTYRHGFKMPENYLETFESRLQLALKSELENIPKTKKQTKDPKVISLLKPLYISIAVAACIAVYSAVNNTQNTLSIDEIAITNIEEYMFENVGAFSLDQITGEFPQQNIVELEESALYDDQQLQKYLLDHLNTNILIQQ
tara:strand:- start:2755 stop:3186 length:432 start_codon:yes stop_codon:yes gene_type:complete